MERHGKGGLTLPMGVNEAIGTIDTASYTKKQLVRLPWDNEEVQSEQPPYSILLLSAKPYKSESNFLNGRSWAYFLYLTSPLSSFQELREAIPMLRRA